jgi:cbb3-type cytochrome oxidase subunit 3
MSSRGRNEDLSTLLYLVPFIASGVYGLVLWIQSGISLTLPTSVYLTVTRDPFLFILGTLSVLLGVMVEVNSTELKARRSKLQALSGTLQSMAVASLILVLLAAWYSNGFTDLGDAATDFIIGRYGIVFPAMLVLLSYLISAQFRLASLTGRKALGLIAMLLVPVSLYEIGRRTLFVGLLIAFILLLAGLGIYLYPERKAASKEEG